MGKIEGCDGPWSGIKSRDEMMADKIDLEWIPSDALQACAHLLRIIRDQHHRIVYLETQVEKLMGYAEETRTHFSTLDRELCRVASKLEELD